MCCYSSLCPPASWCPVFVIHCLSVDPSLSSLPALSLSPSLSLSLPPPSPLSSLLLHLSLTHCLFLSSPWHAFFYKSRLCTIAETTDATASPLMIFPCPAVICVCVCVSEERLTVLCVSLCRRSGVYEV